MFMWSFGPLETLPLPQPSVLWVTCKILYRSTIVMLSVVGGRHHVTHESLGLRGGQTCKQSKGLLS